MLLKQFAMYLITDVKVNNLTCNLLQQCKINCKLIKI